MSVFFKTKEDSLTIKDLVKTLNEEVYECLNGTKFKSSDKRNEFLNECLETFTVSTGGWTISFDYAFNNKVYYSINRLMANDSFSIDKKKINHQKNK